MEDGHQSRQKKGDSIMSDTYPPISDYGYIGDCHSAALVSRQGSIDWCCMPRMDSRSCFCRLLDWRNGGFCRISPAGSFETSRKYLENSLILETTFTTGTGKVRLLDFFPMHVGGKHEPYRQILRIAEGLEGSIVLALRIKPRFDFGAVKAWIRTNNDGLFVAIGGSDGLLISGDFSMDIDNRHDLAGNNTIREGQRLYLSMFWRKPENLDKGQPEVPEIPELEKRFEETREWW
jgi:GH15 family glucan-1,4-alpha-glucosidase